MSEIDGANAVLRSNGFDVQTPRILQASGYPWEHEVRVALPATYAETERAYPVLWVLDNMLELALTTLPMGAQVIVASVGAPSSADTEFMYRRTYDFTTERGAYGDGPTGDYARAAWDALSPVPWKHGGAAAFLDFLIDDVRPAISADYRIDADAHGIFGYSGGGFLVGYAIFARPGAFSRYICGSPSLYAGCSHVFEMESAYAATHDDLPARIFFSAGEAELTEPMIAPVGCVSSMAKLVETLSIRHYPSLQLTARVFPGESHVHGIATSLSWGLRAVWPELMTPLWG